MDSTPRASPAPPSSKTEGMAPQASRGSTPTATRPASRLVRDGGAAKPVRAASSKSLKQKMAAKNDEPPRPSKADEVGAEHAQRIARDADTDTIQQLKVLKGEFDSLRSHRTCKICDRLLYEPYSVACGH